MKVWGNPDFVIASEDGKNFLVHRRLPYGQKSPLAIAWGKSPEEAARNAEKVLAG